LNRQQRRELARRRATENKYIDQLIDRQNRVDARTLEMNLICLALALRKVCG